jgi:transforming growth factor-beta-induced protein
MALQSLKVVCACATVGLVLNGCGSSETTTASPVTSTTAQVGTLTIAELAVATPQLSTLVTALSAAGLVNAFNSTDQTLTVFAPTNDAFNAVDSTLLTCLLLPVGITTLQSLLKYHAVNGKVLSSDLTNDEVVTTLNQQNVTVSINGSVVKIDKATVTAANLLATNGVVHEIDAVMIPPVFVAPNCGTSGSVAQLAVATPDLSTLVAALQAASLVSVFNGTDIYTVFAPTNEAFNAFGQAMITCLTTQQIPALTELLKYHVVAGYDLAATISDGTQLGTLDEQNLTFAVTGTIVKINGKATVTVPNQFANNGVVHVIDAVLIPPVWTNPCATSADSEVVV